MSLPDVYSRLQQLIDDPNASPGVLVQRMFVPADRVVALRIYCGYCILRRRILTELVFGGHDARQTEGTPDRASQGLAGLLEDGSTLR